MQLRITNLLGENCLGYRVKLYCRLCKTTTVCYSWLCVLGTIFQESRTILPLIHPKGDVYKGRFEMKR